VKRGTPEHPKVFDLCERLKIRRPAAVGYLELLWHFTAKFAPQGDIGRFSERRIEAALDWSGASGKLVNALTESRWLDRHAEHRLIVHDWHDHADDAVRKRLARLGLKFLTVIGKVTGQNTDTDWKASATQVKSGCLPEPEPEPAPGPLPLPRPEPRLDTSDAARKKRAQSPECELPLSHESEEIRETMRTWLNIDPTAEQVSAVLGELRGLPAASFVAYLNGLSAKCRPGGVNAPRSPGWFKTTARTWATEGPAGSDTPTPRLPDGCRHGLPDGGCPQCNPRAADKLRMNAF